MWLGLGTPRVNQKAYPVYLYANLCISQLLCTPRAHTTPIPLNLSLPPSPLLWLKRHKLTSTILGFAYTQTACLFTFPSFNQPSHAHSSLSDFSFFIYFPVQHFLALDFSNYYFFLQCAHIWFFFFTLLLITSANHAHLKRLLFSIFFLFTYLVSSPFPVVLKEVKPHRSPDVPFSPLRSCLAIAVYFFMLFCFHWGSERHLRKD